MSNPRVTLTFEQVVSILYDMGWDSEDVDTFWQSANREMKEPGFIDRRNDAFVERMRKRLGPKA